MGLFDRFRRVRRTVLDPVFGELEHHESGCWRGDVLFEPAGEEVGVEIRTSGPEPTHAHRAFFEELRQRYSSLVPAIAGELLRLYAPHIRDEGTQGQAPPRSPEEMMLLVRLDWVELISETELMLGYGFRPEVGWDDAVLTVSVRNWSPSGESLAD